MYYACDLEVDTLIDGCWLCRLVRVNRTWKKTTKIITRQLTTTMTTPMKI